MIRGIFLIWTEQETKICKQLSEILVSNKAVESNPIGLEANAVLIKKLFEDKGCKVRTIENPKATYRPIIIAEIGEESNCRRMKKNKLRKPRVFPKIIFRYVFPSI